MSERKPAKPRMRIRPSVVISMTTHPGRDGTLGPTIASLLAQSYPIAEIRVYCTAQCAPLPAGVTRVTVAHDLGPLTKLSAVCDGRVARKALVVTVDDDNVYDAELVERLVADAERYPDEVICALGWDYDTAQQGSRKFVYLAPGAPVAILGGSGGVLYRKSFFGPDVLQAPAAFFHVDDFWISAYLRRRNIGIRQADVKWRNKWCPLHQEDANRPGLHTRPDFMDLCTNAYLLGFSRDPMPRIIISLTTHPGRNGTLQPTIDSLLAQTRAPDEIRLYHGAGCRDLPSGCRCIEVADIGPLTKLTAVTDPSLRPDDLVITVDDDQRYQETWLARLLELAAAFPDDAVGFSGWNADELLRGGSYVFHKKSGACDVLEGWAGAAYRPRFFGPGILQAPLAFKNVDDVWISGQLQARGINRFCLGQQFNSNHDGGQGLHHAPNFIEENRTAAALAFGPRQPLLSICIVSMHARGRQLARLLEHLHEQPRIHDVEVLIAVDGRHQEVWHKRNCLLQQANGRFVVAFDDDDLPAPNYLDAVLSAIETRPDVDVVLVRGRARTLDDSPIDGHPSPMDFDYELGSKHWHWRGGAMWNTPSHLCPVRADIAKAHPLRAAVWGEDLQWGDILAPHLHTSVRAGAAGEALYFYELDTRKTLRRTLPVELPAPAPHAAVFAPLYARCSDVPDRRGSSAAYTAPYRAFVAEFCRVRGIRSVVDMPCGDMQVGAAIDYGAASYLGVDVIAERIAENRKLFPDRQFVQADMTTWTPAPADLLLVKDCLQHWSNAEVRAWLERLKTMKFCYALITNCAYGPTLNSDCATGQWRALDLTQAPFGVGEVVFAWGPPEHHKKVILLRGAQWQSRNLLASAAPAAPGAVRRGYGRFFRST